MVPPLAAAFLGRGKVRVLATRPPDRDAGGSKLKLGRISISGNSLGEFHDSLSDVCCPLEHQPTREDAGSPARLVFLVSGDLDVIRRIQIRHGQLPIVEVRRILGDAVNQIRDVESCALGHFAVAGATEQFSRYRTSRNGRPGGCLATRAVLPTPPTRRGLSVRSRIAYVVRAQAAKRHTAYQPINAVGQLALVVR